MNEEREDFPSAASSTENNEGKTQRQVCLENIKKLNPKTPYVSVVFEEAIDNSLVQEIEEKGYRVKYALEYDTKKDKKTTCTVRISNPCFNDPVSNMFDSFEDNIKKFSFNVNNLNNPNNPNNLNDDTLKTFFNKLNL